jgi:hypothetical protein
VEHCYALRRLEKTDTVFWGDPGGILEPTPGSSGGGPRSTNSNFFSAASPESGSTPCFRRRAWDRRVFPTRGLSGSPHAQVYRTSSDRGAACFMDGATSMLRGRDPEGTGDHRPATGRGEQDPECLRLEGTGSHRPPPAKSGEYAAFAGMEHQDGRGDPPLQGHLIRQSRCNINHSDRCRPMVVNWYPPHISDHVGSTSRS